MSVPIFCRGLGLGVVCAGLLACSSEIDDRPGTLAIPDGYGDYRDQNASAIGNAEVLEGEPSESDDSEPPPSTGVIVGTPSGTTGDVCFGTDTCVTPDSGGRFCEREGGPVDLIYVDGELVETICYPPASDPERPVVLVDTTEQGDIEIVQTANNTSLIFSDELNGEPIVGDIEVDGNNVAIYGNGADNTIVDGDVILDGNNVRLRGLTITGDLVLRKNNVAIVLCRVLGDVVLEGPSTNNSVIAESEIFGNLGVSSNGNLIVGNGVLGSFEVAGHGNTCDRNYAFTDDDADQRVSEDERGDPLTCS